MIEIKSWFFYSVTFCSGIIIILEHHLVQNPFLWPMHESDLFSESWYKGCPNRFWKKFYSKSFLLLDNKKLKFSSGQNIDKLESRDKTCWSTLYLCRVRLSLFSSICDQKFFHTIYSLWSWVGEWNNLTSFNFGSPMDLNISSSVSSRPCYFSLMSLSISCESWTSSMWC